MTTPPLPSVTDPTVSLPQGPRRGPLVPLTLTFACAGVIGAGALMLRSAEANTNKVALASEAKGVTVVEARAASYRPSRRYVGTLQPWLMARLGPQLVSAYVDTVLVRPGASVRRNEVLATLDCRGASTQSQTVAMQARALEARQRAVASEAARLEKLVDGGFVSANEVEQKRSQSTAEQAQLLAVRSQLSSRSLEVNDCVLKAPFDGEVSGRYVDPGAFVRPGTPVVAMVDRGTIRLTSDVPEPDFDAVAPGTPARIRLVATGKQLAGVIARRSPAADPATRTVQIEIDLDDRDRAIPVGTTAEVGVDVGEPAAATEIPLTAAKVKGSKATVFVVEGDVARSVTVEVLGEAGGSLFVKPTLAAGTRVVTEGRGLLSNGDRVVTKAESMASPRPAASGSGSAPPSASSAKPPAPPSPPPPPPSPPPRPRPTPGPPPSSLKPLPPAPPPPPIGPVKNGGASP